MERFEMVEKEEAHKLGLYPKPSSYEYGYAIVENLPDGTKRLVGCDGGEPEDQSFGRDLGWVLPALLAAFKAGAEIDEWRDIAKNLLGLICTGYDRCTDDGHKVIWEKLGVKNKSKCLHGGVFRGEKCSVCGEDVR